VLDLAKDMQGFADHVSSLLIGNAMLLLLNLPLAGVWVKLLRIPRPYLYAGILMFAALGSYTINLSPIDLALLFLLGILGYVFNVVFMIIERRVLAWHRGARASSLG